MCHARNPENTSPRSVNKLPTVPKTTEGEHKEDLEESEPGMADKQDDAGDDVSLASGGETTAFSSFMMSQKTAVAPCHQTVENTDMEISLDDEEDDEPRRLSRARPVAKTCGFIK